MEIDPIPRLPFMTPPDRRVPDEEVGFLETPDSPIDRPARGGDMSLLAPVMSLARRWRIVIVVPVVFALLTMVYTAIVGVDFASESRFAPHSGKTAMSNLDAVAAQFGIAVAGGGQTESVEFYSQLLRSRELLQGVVLSSYGEQGVAPGDETSGTPLLELWDITGDTREEQLLEGVRQLRDAVQVNPDLRANILTVRAEAKSPWLAEQINRRLLDLVNQFNLEKRQSQATAERAFVEARMGDAQLELLAAEDSLQRFLTKNRSYAQSPTLQFEAGRLERQVDFRQQVFNSLAQSYEQARIDEVRNTPVITILDTPEGSGEAQGSMVKSAAMGFILGAILAVLFALAIEFWLGKRRDKPIEYEALSDQLRRTVREMGSVRGWLRPGA
jgi:uncharacterized protein involved in exopolysaccharide biosynthesis